MKIKRLILKNFKCYDSLDLVFNDGVTVISGLNGSGKSSILEAINIALYGGSSLGSMYHLSDVITNGKSNSSIILFFDHLEDKYKIERDFKIINNNQAFNIKSLIYKNNKLIIEKSKKTHEFILNLLNMNEKSYSNYSYIKQGDIDFLINSKSKERQKIIDDLLQVGVIEDYIERTIISKNIIIRYYKNYIEKYSETNKNLKSYNFEKLFELINSNNLFLYNINLKIEHVNKKNFYYLRKKSNIEFLEKKYYELKKEIDQYYLLRNELKIKFKEYNNNIIKLKKKQLVIENIFYNKSSFSLKNNIINDLYYKFNYLFDLKDIYILLKNIIISYLKKK